MAHILLIEDYPSLQKIYQATLEAANHTVYLADDVKEGLEIARSKQVDLILLDLLLPHAGGLDFLKSYNIKKHSGTKVIILSNIFSTDLLNQALALGASHYFLKTDMNPKKLSEVVDQTLSIQSRIA